MERFETRLRATEPGFRELLGRIQLQATPPLPPDWLRWEMLERDAVLRRASLAAGSTVLEIGSGPHAIATVPLAYRAGRAGRLVAVELSRWGQFRGIVASGGMQDRIRPLVADARRLPLRGDSAELAVCLHGIRSLHGEEAMVRTFREMLRASPRIFLAESLPIARTEGQRAHLMMYELREDVFSSTMGSRDDLHYLPLDRLASLVESAGGVVEKTETLEVDLPHFLAYFPRSLVESIPQGTRREELLRRWDEADRVRRQYGEDHPPVGIVIARRS
ncbi:MAG TPA: class I SAM-dependent methyltransferase [Thermoplasmata archaeon]|nr:class I SAM-dependent methyltransferase [Thermoplasmata archaeon]